MSIKDRLVRWFLRRKLEALQKQLQQSQKEGRPMKISPATRATIVFVAVALAQMVLDYIRTTQAPGWREGFISVGYGMVGLALLWLRSGRLPSPDEIQASLQAGSLKIHNDDPRDPVVLKVDGVKISKAPPPDLGNVTPPALKG